MTGYSRTLRWQMEAVTSPSRPRAAGSVIPRLWYALAWNAGNPDRQAPLPQPGPLPETKMIFAASDLIPPPAPPGPGYRGRGP